ncbi:MAG TPA: hypothetical protein PLV92_28855, partial [Pirellulaceae bacterium]|nr:hypothetical protein [Pirellulaceae bacterium]
MESAAGRTGGAVVQINPDEALEWRAFELLSELNAPRLTDIRVDAPDTTFLTLTKSIADGQELAAVARLPLDRPSPSKVTIRAKLNGRDYSFELAAPPTLVKPEPTSVELNGWTIAGHLPRTWAKLEIDRLTSLGAQENRAEITTLSKAMYVMSPFTSLLVLETEAMYEQFKVDRGRKDHWAPYPAPETLPPTDVAPNAAQQPPTPLAAARDRLKLIQARVQAAKKQHERAVADHRPASEIARLQRALTAETSDEKRVANEIARLEKEESNANDPLVKAWRSVVFRDPTTVGAVNQANVGRRWREATWDGNGWTRNEVRLRSRGRLGRVRTDNSIDDEVDFIDLYIRDGRSER